jgi:hypothetical protein
MKLEKIAAIAEIVGSVAIVVTLGYLAVQTRQTNNALLANSRQATMSADVAMITAAIQAPEAWANLRRPYSELSPQERDQAANVLAGLIRVREYAWFQYKNGVMDEPTLRSYMAPVTRWLRFGDTPATVWQEFSPEWDPEFVAYVEMLKDSATQRP